MTTRQKTLAQDTQVIVEALDTKAQSLVFVKRMVVIAVSSITYLRGMFPENSYRSRYLEDLCIKVLKQDCSCPEARKLIKWLLGYFDALEKRYLQMVVIGVHTSPDNSNVTKDCEQDLPSEDESIAQFKQPKKAIAKRKCVRSKVTRRKKKKCF